jgi:hypothetical protein
VPHPIICRAAEEYVRKHGKLIVKKLMKQTTNFPVLFAAGVKFVYIKETDCKAEM